MSRFKKDQIIIWDSGFGYEIASYLNNTIAYGMISAKNIFSKKEFCDYESKFFKYTVDNINQINEKYSTNIETTLEIQAEDTYFYKIDMRGVKDYFFTKSEWRKIKINKILKKCQT